MSENIVPQPENTPDEVEELVEELEVHSAEISDPGADTAGCATNTCSQCSGTC